ncbi:probable receptor kinase At1g11050 [Olea europaea subsp. europaea]|uniref:non-specific serine/threonine protein kinase n=1 Tax=Olea europaea subsp. europaea TaxID=158383 RepID=A0A8S0QD43_OLEEU|nr:probable receptor kinase At1g11050 [Olea europaea subsp. europaea]
MFVDFSARFIPLVCICIFLQNLVSSSPISTSQCPMNFNYVLTIHWDSSACKNNGENPDFDGSSSCCQTLISLYGIGFAQHLKQTSQFRLPDLSTSISCLSDFQTRLNSLSLNENLISMCFEPHRFVNTTNICANIQTKQDWLAALGPSTSLDTGCSEDLSDLTACDACVHAGFQVQARLLAIDGNSSHSKGCFYYAILYAAGIVNKFGPESIGALTCIFGLPLSLQAVSRGTVELALISGSVGAGFAISIVLCSIGCFIWWESWDSRKKRQEVSVGFSSLESDADDNKLLHWEPQIGSTWFKSDDLDKATKNFSSKNFIGEGQFGVVYKGKLPDGTMIAVKKIIDSDFQVDTDFIREVEIISTLKHRNLVPFRGCCVSRGSNYNEEEDKRYLVYDYMSNGNLHDHLFFSEKGKFKNGKRPLTWPQRKSIILDVANALAYLHYGVKPPVYHRDIKPTNILLDSYMRARVADFGLAKQGSEGDSHFTTRIAGTHGYLAPEYALYGQLTEKSDVYSFGIVILEIMCGRKALDLSSLENPNTFLITDWAWSLMKAGRVKEVFDPFLLEDEGSVNRYPKEIMERFLLVGLLCAHLMVALRPTILDALKMLEGDTEVPVIPDRPIYTHESVLISALTRKNP